MSREYEDTPLVFSQIAKHMRSPLAIVNFGAECFLELIWRKECMGVKGAHLGRSSTLQRTTLAFESDPLAVARFFQSGIEDRDELSGYDVLC